MTRNLILILSLLLGSLQAMAQVWAANPVRVGTGGYDIGLHSKIQVVNGKPAVAYYDYANGDLMYVRANDSAGTTWGTHITIASAGDVGQYLSMIIVSGNPAISYYNANNGTLQYVRATNADGSAWGTPLTLNAGTNVGQYTSMALISGCPAIACYDAGNTALIYITAADATGTTWNPVTIVAGLGSTGDVGEYASLALVSGQPAIAYFNATTGKLNYAYLSSSPANWVTGIIVDNAVGSVECASLAVVFGRPAIAYYQPSNGGLRYQRSTSVTGHTWPSSFPVVVDASSADVGQYASLSVLNAMPVISYYNATNNCLSLAWARNGIGSASNDWSVTTLSLPSSNIGVYPHTTLVGGKLAVVCYDTTNTSLVYHRSNDPFVSGTTTYNSWQNKTIDRDTTAGTHTSLAIVNGNPAIACYDVINKNLLYARATTTDGSDWNRSVIVAATGDVGQAVSLVVSGLPAISYVSVGIMTNTLRYVRASDLSGTNWGAPVTVSTNARPTYTKLVVIGGNPAIVYYQNSALYYVRATNFSGSAWGTPVAVSTGTINTNFPFGFAEVNGLPAVSYYSSGLDMVYTRASNTAGANFTTSAVTIESAGDVGRISSLAIVNNNPAIAYANTTTNTLKYVRASDVNGAAWGMPVIVNTSPGSSINLVALPSRDPIIVAGNNNGTHALVGYSAVDGDGLTWSAPQNLVSSSSSGTYCSAVSSSNFQWFAAYYDANNKAPVVLRGTSNAQNWTGSAGTTDWFTPGNWTDGVPSPSTGVTIPTGLGVYPSINNLTTAYCKSLIIQIGASLTINGTLTVSGDVSNSGTLNSANGDIVMYNAVAKILLTNSPTTVKNLTVNNEGGVTLYGNWQIPATGSYTPMAGVLTINNSLTLKSDATGTARIAQGSSSGGYIGNNVVIERYVPGGRRAFRFFGHPFTSSIALNQFTDDLAVTGRQGATNGFTPTTSNNPSAYYYDPAMGVAGQPNDPGWQAYTSANTGNWARHQGMRLLVRGAGTEGTTTTSYTPSAVTIDWIGPLNQGTQTINLTKGTGSGINIVGNPFASPVVMGTALHAMANKDGSTYWVWNPMLTGNNGKGAYVPLLIGAAATDVIPSGSAVVVKVSANTTLTVNESNKATTETVNTFRTTAIAGMAELHVFDTAGAYYDRIYVRDDAAANNNKEQLDGEKFNNPTANFYVWSADSQKLSLDTRPFMHGDVIPLGFTSTEKQPFVIEVMSNEYPAGTQLTLHDKYLSTFTPLDMGVRYTFDVTSDTLSQGDERFELGVIVMPAPPPVTRLKEIVKTKLEVNCLPNPASDFVNVSIMSSEVKHAMVSVYDLSGSIVYRKRLGELKDSVERVWLRGLASGMYLLTVQHGKEIVTGRVIKQ